MPGKAACRVSRLLIVFLSAAAPLCAADQSPANNKLSPDDIAAGWIQLFDGETLFGWKAGSDADWAVKDGVISASQGAAGLLCTTCEFSDYELRCDFRLEKGGNSGIFLHTPLDPKDPSQDCYELNICDSHPKFKTGSIVALKQPDKEVSGEGEWKTYHLVVHGPKIEVQLDAEQVLSFHDERPEARKRGFIGLQKNAGLAEYRNVYLRPLELKPLFDGKDLAGWREVPGGKSQFTVEDGAIRIRNGRGYLETEQTFADFILQAECRTHGKNLNGGIFFRALPGTEQNPADGYESQVHNGFKDNDRTKPVDFGTGAIYRRVPARRVVSNDNEWFSKTIVAQGPHFAVWVNGYPVTDWFDIRKPNDNPRNGLRLKAGHISLQGHDPTTDVEFRNLKIAEFGK